MGLNGVMVYEILPNGCLNGVYSNDHPKTNNQIFNDVARKKISDNGDEILGEYICGFIGSDNTVWDCKLIIHNRPKRVQNGQYHFEWYDKNDILIFEGTGWRTKANQIAVSYRDVEARDYDI